MNEVKRPMNHDGICRTLTTEWKLQPASYIIYKDSSTIKAINGITGAVDYSGTDWGIVMQNVVNKVQTNGGKIFIKAGTYLQNTKVMITEPITIEGEGGDYVAKDLATTIKASAAISAMIEINITHTGNADTGGVIKNILLNGNSNAKKGLLITRDVRLLCEKVSIINCTMWGLVDLFNHSHHFIDCQFSYNGANNTANPPTSGGAYLGDATYILSAISFDRCCFEANLGCGLYVWHTQALSINDTVIESNYSFGMVVSNQNQAVHNTTFKNIYFEGNMTVTGQTNANYIYPGSDYILWISPFFYENMAINCIFDQTQEAIWINPYVVGTSKILFYTSNGIVYIGNTDFVVEASVLNSKSIYALDSFGPNGFSVTTPAFPASGVDVKNTNLRKVRIMISGIGDGITAYGITDGSGTLNSITCTVTAGQIFEIDPGCEIRFTYTGFPTWIWYGA